MLKKQRTYQFENDELLTNLVDDLATEEKLSRSQVIETVLINTYLSSHREAKYWSKNLLLKKSNIGETLSVVFDYLAVETSLEEKYQNGKPLVVYAQDYLLSHPIFLEKQDHGSRQYLAKQLNVIIEIVENDLTDDIAHISKNEIVDAKDICKFLASDEKLSPIWLYSFIIQHWETLKSSTYTYRLLSQFSLLHQQIIKDSRGSTAAERLELLRVLKYVSNDWGSSNTDYLQDAINRIDKENDKDRNISLLLDYLLRMDIGDDIIVENHPTLLNKERKNLVNRMRQYLLLDETNSSVTLSHDEIEEKKKLEHSLHPNGYSNIQTINQSLDAIKKLYAVDSKNDY